MKKLLPVLALVTGLSVAHAGTTYTFTGAGTSSSYAPYDSSSNWNPSTSYPMSGDTADFGSVNTSDYVDVTNGVAGILNIDDAGSKGFLFENGPLTMANGSSDAQFNINSDTVTNPTINSTISILNGTTTVGGNSATGDGNLTFTDASGATSGLTLGSATAASFMPTVTGSTADLTLTNTSSQVLTLGYLSDNGGTLNVILNGGEGSIQLTTETSAFAGKSVSINSGLVTLSAGSGLTGAGSATTGTDTVNSGGTLNTEAKTGIKGNFVLNGSGSGTTSTGTQANNGALVSVGGTAATPATINGSAGLTVKLSSNSTIAVDNTSVGAASYLSIQQQVTGTGMLSMTGGGFLYLDNTSANASNYSGGTVVLSGTLIGQVASSLGTGSTLVDGGATLTLDVSNTMASTAGLTFADTSDINIDYNTTSQTLEYVYDSTTGTYGATGTYTASALDSMFGDSVFANSTGTGTFTILTAPEPSACALLGLGSLAFLVWRRRTGSCSLDV